MIPIVAIIIFVLGGIIVLVTLASKYESKQKMDIEQLWGNKGFFAHISEKKVLGFNTKNIIAVQSADKYCLVGANWVVSTGKTTIPYWGVAILLRHIDFPKFSISKRKPWIFDGGRVKFNDFELDKMITVKCKDKDWFLIYFSEGLLRQTAEMMPKGTIIHLVKNIPVNFSDLSELTGFELSPFVIVQRTETINNSNHVDSIVNIAQQLGKMLSR
ncbi:hypothetical protein KAU32_09740 [bacterium]|nr:hypothetical protein [bacterium]